MVTTRLGMPTWMAAKPDAGRVVHGLEHVLDELADAGVDFLHRFGYLPQPLVRQNENVAQRHGGDVSGRPGIGQCRRRAPLATAMWTRPGSSRRCPD